MTLRANGWLLGVSPCRWNGGTGLIAGVAVDTGLLMQPGQMRNLLDGDSGMSRVTSIPEGTEGSPCWMLAQEGGGLASRKGLRGAGGVSPALGLARECDATLAGSGTVAVADMKLIVALAGALAGAGTITQATASGVVQMAAALVGTGDIEAALGLIAFCSAALTGAGGASAASNLTGLAAMSALITAAGEVLSAANVDQAVLDKPDGLEPGVTVREGLRAAAALAAGDIEAIDANTRRVRAIGNPATTRIESDVTPTERTVTLLDLD